MVWLELLSGRGDWAADLIYGIRSYATTPRTGRAGRRAEPLAGIGPGEPLPATATPSDLAGGGHEQLCQEQRALEPPGPGEVRPVAPTEPDAAEDVETAAARSGDLG